MTLPATVAAVGLVAVCLYAIFGGADFGGGVWDLFATGPRREAQRKAIALAMGPVWETNHVWLIFIIVLLFTAFPSLFAELSIALYIPLTFVLVGVILRGAAFAFRAHAYYAARTSGAWGSVFGVASTITPFLFGASAGALAEGSFNWMSPFALTIGVLAVAVCAQLAAVFLTLETGDETVRTDFERRALISSLLVAAIGAFALGLARISAPGVFASLFIPRALICIGIAMACGLLVFGSLLLRRFVIARIAVAAEIICILLGWFAAQAPYLIPHRVTIYDAASPDATLRAMLWTTAAGAVFLIPSLWLLFAVFKGQNPAVTGQTEEHEAPAKLLGPSG